MSRRRLPLLCAALVAAAGWIEVPAAAGGDDAPSPAVMERAREQVRRAERIGSRAPDFGRGLPWLNVSRPLSLSKDLRGKVVVLDFWCTCCVNCMHVLPDLAWLEKRYAGKAVAIVGVHSAKFTTEKDADAVRQAVVRYEIAHPVAVDADFSVFHSFQATGWPHFVVIAPDGTLLDGFGGEGHREELDALISVALERWGAKPGALDATPLPLRRESASLPPGELSYPGKLIVDVRTKLLYIADTGHHRIVETDLDGRFRRVFGDGEPGFRDGAAGAARFHRPQGLLVLDRSEYGALYVADAENHAVRRIRLDTGVVETVAGTGKQGYESSGTFPARGVDLSTPWDLCGVGKDPTITNAVLVACAGNHQIWLLDLMTERISAWAGDHTERRLDAKTLTQAAFAQPSGLSMGGKFVYVADSESSSIRRITWPAGPVETLAGASPSPTDLFSFGFKDGKGFEAKFQHPLGVLCERGVVWVADTYNHAIRTVIDGKVTTAFGTGEPGHSDEGTGTFSEPSGLAIDGDRLYVADTNNHRVRVLDTNPYPYRVTTLRLTGVPLPMSAARAASAPSAWPEFPDTARATQPPTAVASGKPLSLEVKIVLPEGWHLTEGAPSAVRVEGIGEAVEAKVSDTTTTVALGALPAAGATLRVRLLYYVCKDEGSCRVRSADVTLPLTSSPAGSAPAPLSVTDAFPP